MNREFHPNGRVKRKAKTGSIGTIIECEGCGSKITKKAPMHKLCETCAKTRNDKRQSTTRIKNKHGVRLSECIICGGELQPYALKYCKGCGVLSSYVKNRILSRRKLESVWDKKGCWCCDITDYELMTFGHPDGNGSEHKAHIGLVNGHSSGRIARWILTANDAEIKEWNIRLECGMCNMFHFLKGHYPTHEERKEWGKGE